MNLSRTFCRIATVVMCLTVSSRSLHARKVSEGTIPAFARRYGVTCQLCHSPIPTLTAFGEAFAGNGFRMSSAESARDTIATGDPLLELSRTLPLAIRFDAFAQLYLHGRAETDFQLPYYLKILSGGPISPSISYYLYFFLFERGEVGGIEDAFVYLNDIAGKPVDLTVGQFQVSDPLFKRELRLEYQDYAIYRARIGSQPADLTYDRGLMLITDVAGFTATGVVVNGNGRGPAEPNRRLDNDLAKNFMLHLTRDLAPGVRLGILGYRGRQSGARESGPKVTNQLWMAGVDGTLNFRSLELNFQILHREDSRPTFDPAEPSAVTDGGFVELIVRPLGSRAYGVALYNRVQTNRPLLNVRLGGPPNLERYETLTVGGGYLVQRNVRAYVEATWDTQERDTRWTLGLTTAF